MNNVIRNLLTRDHYINGGIYGGYNDQSFDENTEFIISDKDIRIADECPEDIKEKAYRQCHDNVDSKER